MQAANTVAIVAIVALAALKTSRETSYVVAVLGSQLASPILWDHYGLILLLPVAWLLERRRWWALLVPLSEAWVLVPVIPTFAYAIAFYATLLAVIAVGWAREPQPVLPQPVPA